MSGHPNRIVIEDDLRRRHVFQSPPGRIVSLVPSITETVVLLGADQRLVGITDYCVHPEDALADIPRVGGTKNPDVPDILSLEPDVVLANKEENRKRDVEALEKQVPVFVTYPTTVRESLKTVRDLGTLLNAEDEAAKFTEECEGMMRSIAQDVTVSKPLRTACMIWRDPWMAVGPNTYASDLLKALGFENVYGSRKDRYPVTSLEELAERRPDVILLPNEPYEFDEGDKSFVEDFVNERGVSAMILLLMGSHLTWFGSRTLAALEYLLDIRRRLG
ncbi:MAG: ABC transporter substrate-binding protein [Candidatus Latescibacteria bacterium]|nr:ABC transporter substrate-binding protein [Candidatus Latescibacterota bacterium]NIM66335.1 ABC transporter substrate-binding protein [Candidatus Latescibacterota bacterium]NIO02814.1 ABC transporter substrate-binding protein [Candidatus Latescibacterota bacterium]NIO29949.1 ABC transporter substrate-binding protein [Candidatus Latescibacterota bacterium]NIO57564.1 ABC transporter substrate-binding protein [Candidatus Latescibacterota bacterium]